MLVLELNVKIGDGYSLGFKIWVVMNVYDRCVSKLQISIWWCM
jgi:hypothetical protein